MKNSDFEYYLKLYEEMVQSFVELHNNNIKVSQDLNKNAAFKVRRTLRKISRLSIHMRRMILDASREHARQLAEQGIVREDKRKKLSINQKTRIRANFRKASMERAAYKIK
jgi:hypothetical protein